ncbi:hypothetical protein [Cellulosilyticum ruminicola]|uniref:hypothetical protein n=1 Tax=Cellulosilyticum ruminicola TaxID=425254 RepID=UPI0006D052EA|nr:hypothetical protein [Cellulosilyticum ruminicola]
MIHFAHDNGEPFAFKFDKRKLLDDLYKVCKSVGVGFRMRALATAYTVKYFLEGVEGIEAYSWNLYYGQCYRANAPAIIGPSMEGNHLVEMTLTGDVKLKPNQIFERLREDSPFGEQLKMLE